MEISQESETAATLAAENRVIPRGLLVVEKDSGKAKLGVGAPYNDTAYWQPAGPGYTPTPQAVDPESETLAEDLLGALVALGLVVEAE